MAKSRIDQLKSLIAMDPEDHTLHYMIGLEYLESAQYDEAVAAFERYLETEEARDGDIGSCLGRLAEGYERMGAERRRHPGVPAGHHERRAP